MSPVTHLYFDHPYEPDPEERGYYWGPRYTDTKKVFGYDAMDMYNNIDVSRMGDPLTKDNVCKDENGENICEVLTESENIIGRAILYALLNMLPLYMSGGCVVKRFLS